MLSPVETEIQIALLRVHGPSAILQVIAEYMEDTLRHPDGMRGEDAPVERVATIQQRLALRQAHDQTGQKGRGRNQAITKTVLGQVKKLRQEGQTMPQVAHRLGFSESGIYHALQEERQKKR